MNVKFRKQQEDRRVWEHMVMTRRETAERREPHVYQDQSEVTKFTTAPLPAPYEKGVAKGWKHSGYTFEVDYELNWEEAIRWIKFRVHKNTGFLLEPLTEHRGRIHQYVREDRS